MFLLFPRPLILFAFWIFAKMSFKTFKLIVLSLVGVVHPQNMFCLDVAGVCFKGVRYSLLFLRCSFVVWVFGEKPSFGPTCLLCLHYLDSLCSLFVLFVFCVCVCVCVSACLVFLMGSALFLWNALRRIGIAFPSLSCPRVASSTSCPTGSVQSIFWLFSCWRRADQWSLCRVHTATHHASQSRMQHMILYDFLSYIESDSGRQ